jgi:hypothetical protein
MTALLPDRQPTRCLGTTCLRWAAVRSGNRHSGDRDWAVAAAVDIDVSGVRSRRDPAHVDLERARAVAALGEQLVTRSLAARQERVNLGLTGVIGAVVTVLTAIQAFGYQVPLPEAREGRGDPARHRGARASAPALSAVVLRAASGRRRASAAALSGALGLLAATVVWLGTAVVCTLLGLSLRAPGTVTLLAAGGALAVAAVAAPVMRRHPTT